MPRNQRDHITNEFFVVFFFLIIIIRFDQFETVGTHLKTSTDSFVVFRKLSKMLVMPKIPRVSTCVIF